MLFAQGKFFILNISSPSPKLKGIKSSFNGFECHPVSDMKEEESELLELLERINQDSKKASSIITEIEECLFAKKTIFSKNTISKILF